jgi:YD repeat-containing protein
VAGAPKICRISPEKRAKTTDAWTVWTPALVESCTEQATESGLRVVETLSGRNHRHEYGTDGRLTRIVDPAAPTVSVIGYSYNDRGNATSRTSATGFIPNTSSIVSDEANRVRSMTTAGALETFTCDGHGRRTRATTSWGTLMHFYTQAGRVLTGY